MEREWEKEPYYLFDLEIWLVYHWSNGSIAGAGHIRMNFAIVLALSFYHTACHRVKKIIMCRVYSMHTIQMHEYTHQKKRWQKKKKTEIKHGNGRKDVTKDNFTRRNVSRNNVLPLKLISNGNNINTHNLCLLFTNENENCEVRRGRERARWG